MKLAVLNDGPDLRAGRWWAVMVSGEVLALFLYEDQAAAWCRQHYPNCADAKLVAVVVP